MFLAEKMMKHAITLAKKAYGETLPNPRVGAVIFNENGNILGEGYHKEFGNAHAEVEAIFAAIKNGAVMNQASMCVTLEPCNHTGKTPPCTDIILKSGIKKIYIGTVDDNCNIQCTGIKYLKEKGVQVFTNILAEECKNLNPGFHKYNKTKLPYVQLKIASSLNGKIGDGTWFTSSAAKKRVHELRLNSDLILTGVGTIEKDNPSFNSKLPSGIFTNTVAILDTNLRLYDKYISKDLKVIRDRNRVIIISLCNDEEKISNLKNNGIEVINSCMPDLMYVLANEYFFREIFIEGGSGIMNYFLGTASNYVDKLVLFIAPKWFNQDVKSLFLDNPEKFPDIDFFNMELLDNTLCVEGRFSCLQA